MRRMQQGSGYICGECRGCQKVDQIRSKIHLIFRGHGHILQCLQQNYTGYESLKMKWSKDSMKNRKGNPMWFSCLASGSDKPE